MCKVTRFLKPAHIYMLVVPSLKSGHILPVPVRPGPLPLAESGGGRGRSGPGSQAASSGRTGKAAIVAAAAAAPAVVVCVSLEQSSVVPLLPPAAVAVDDVALPGASEALKVELPLMERESEAGWERVGRKGEMEE